MIVNITVDKLVVVHAFDDSAAPYTTTTSRRCRPRNSLGKSALVQRCSVWVETRFGGQPESRPPLRSSRQLDRANVLRFLALLAGRNVELDLLALVERLVAIALDCGEVDEHVVRTFARDEAETLFGVEELHGTCSQRTLVSQRGPPTISAGPPEGTLSAFQG